MQQGGRCLQIYRFNTIDSFQDIISLSLCVIHMLLIISNFVSLFKQLELV